MRHKIINLIIKTLLLFLCFTLILTSCALNSISADKKAQNDIADNTVAPPYEIVWYHMNPPQKDTEFVLEEVNKYLKNKINATLKLELLDINNYDREITSVISSGRKFDICFTSAWINSYNRNVLKGSFIEMESLLERYGKGTLRCIPEILLDGAKVNGKVYAIPSIKELTHQYCITINKKFLDKYEFDASNIKKLEDLEPMLEIIKKKQPGVVPYLIYPFSCHAFSIPLERIVEQVPSALYFDNRTNYKLVNTFETPEFLQYASLMHKWYNKGYILQDAATLKSIEDYGKSGNWFARAGIYIPGSDSRISYEYGFDVLKTPLNSPFIAKKDIEYHMLAISKTSKDPKRAMMFLELLNTDVYLYNLLSFGIEGRHYKKISENGIDICSDGYYVGNYSFGNNNLSYSLSDGRKKQSGITCEPDSGVIISPLLEFSFDPTPVESEIAGITEVTEEVEGPIFVGAVDPEEYIPKIIEKYKNAGLYKVMAEQQRQLNQWIAGNSNQ
jgi:putative aldouronate transport system substrate-binding protein